MRRLRPSLDNVRLRNKLLLLYVLSVFVPVVLTNALFYLVTTHNVRSQKERDIALLLDRMQNDFRAKIDAAVGISSVFYADGLINDALDRTYESPVDYLDVYDAYIRPGLGRYGPVYHSIQDITIYTDNPTVLGAGGISAVTAEVRRTNWYAAIMAAPSGMPVLVRTGGGEAGAFSILRRLNVSGAPSGYLKLLKIDLHPETARLSLDNRTLQGQLYLIGPDGTVQYTTDPAVDRGIGLPRFADVRKPEDALAFERSYESVDYLRGWSIVALLPERQALAEVRKSRLVVVYLACANLLLPTLIIVWISKSLHDRLLRIVRQMKKVKNRRFEPLPDIGATDEIGQLALEFNRMTEQIRRLIDDVYLADIQKKDLELRRRQAQLHALQSQINPHFLFNVLETLRMRSLIKREEETARIVGSMAKLFRKSLAWGNDRVTVGQEMELIASFLDIQKYRFGDKLQYRIAVDEAAAACRIPKMIFLPFVENASIHGIEAIQGQGLIELAVEAERDRLHFRLRDNGIGMDSRKLEQLRGAGADGEDDTEASELHIGVRNVRARLLLYYGEEAKLEIDSRPGAGTEVRIRVPQTLNFLKENL